MRTMRFLLLLIIAIGTLTSFALVYAATPQGMIDDENPYQNQWDDDSIKTYFLRRIANDMLATDPSFNPWLDAINQNTSAHPKGVFLQTKNDQDLDDLFQTIAKRIQLRLVD